MNLDIIRLVRLALGVICDRLLTLVALAMTFTLACWVMKNPDWLRASMAAFFALCVFIPSIFKERTRHDATNPPPDGL